MLRSSIDAAGRSKEATYVAQCSPSEKRDSNMGLDFRPDGDVLPVYLRDLLLARRTTIVQPARGQTSPTAGDPSWLAMT
jgi:hypothetical protein